MKIEDLKAHCVEQMRKLPKTSKMYEEHLLTLAIIDTNKKYFDEIEKKDEIIDLMADLIYEISKVYPGTVFHSLTHNGFDLSKCDGSCPEKFKICKDCIKQYFERKIEDEEK